MTGEITVRVRYAECDPMGVAHHAAYLPWFEMGRTELLRASGRSYRDMEAEDRFVVVAEATCKFLRPARYDDLLTLRTALDRVRAATLEHSYELKRGDELLAAASTVVCCVDRTGVPQRWPEWMLE